MSLVADLQTNSKPSPETPTGVQVPNPTGEVWSHPAGYIPEILDAEKGIVRRSRNKVAIVGFATSSRHLAPFDSADHEVWILNQLYRHVPRADRHFDIHSNYYEHVVEGSDHLEWLGRAPIPIYMNEYRPQYSASVRYPIEEVIAYFGKDYFTSTVAFMLALAIKEQFEVIEIYGVDLIVGTEWETQRQCAEFYIGWARGAGIDVVVPTTSSLLSQRYRYGYCMKPTDLVSTPDFQIRSERVRERRDTLQLHLALLDGALQECNFHYTEILQTPPDHQLMLNTFAQTTLKDRATEIKTKRDEIQNQLLMLDGALQEDQYWSQLYALRERGGTIPSSE